MLLNDAAIGPHTPKTALPDLSGDKPNNAVSACIECASDRLRGQARCQVVRINSTKHRIRRYAASRTMPHESVSAVLVALYAMIDAA
jgi:hypothetical protein